MYHCRLHEQVVAGVSHQWRSQEVYHVSRTDQGLVGASLKKRGARYHLRRRQQVEMEFTFTLKDVISEVP